MNICFIFRQPRPLFFSIEKVFNQVIPFIKRKCTVQEVSLPQRRIKLLNIFKNIQYIKKKKADIYHVTGDVHYIVMALPKRKTILTIHDCVFIEDTIGLKRKLLKYFFLEWPVRHAAYITTISLKTKQDILKYTRCEESKIVVIPNPVSDTIKFSVKEFNSLKPVILFLGTKANKNLPAAIEALEKISCKLIIIGIVTPDIQKLISKYGLDSEAFNNISENELSQKYAEADIILFPSLYEGFGLPVIEGNKAGRVVITSNISPMKEVANDAACLVDPTNISSIRNGILKVIDDSEYRTELIKNGLQNIKKYEPGIISAQYLEVYEKLRW